MTANQTAISATEFVAQVKFNSASLVPAPSEDVVQVSRTGKKEGGLSVWSYHKGVLKAVESINDP